MTRHGQQRDLAPEIGTLLGRLRRRIRLYVWGDGAAAMGVAVGATFWCGLAFDWLFEPSRPVRIAALAVVGIWLVAVLSRSLLRRAFVHLSDTNLAVLLERRFGQFQDSLLTVVDLADARAGMTPRQQEMIQRTCYQAIETARHVRLGAVLNPRPLVRKTAVAVVLLASIVVFALLARDTFGLWVQRMMLSTDAWPRKTRLVVTGFPQNAQNERSEKVARGADFRLLVKAEALGADPPPEYVELRFRRADGSRGRDGMTRVGNATVDRTPFQSYYYTFKNVELPLTFDVLGGDARISNLRLHVVERPQIVEMSLQCHYPPYLQRRPCRLQVTGAMQIPKGTCLTVRAVASKDLERIRVQDADKGAETDMQTVGTGPPRRFETVLPPILADTVLLLTLLDRDGIASHEPYQLVLHAVPDAIPLVVANLSGIGTAITPNARIPVTGQVTDDHGLDRVWFEYRVDQQDVRSIDFASGPAGQHEQELAETLDTQDFVEPNRLKAGQRLQIAVRAGDRCDLEGGPNVGSSRQFEVEVVTPDQLRTRLDRRELLLRQRFETLIEEMIATRDLMARIDFRPPTKAGPAVEPDSDTVSKPASASAAARPDDAASTADADAQQTPQVQRRLQIARALQNVDRAAHETLDVADAFDEIRQEMVNNRIDTKTHTTRLREGITEPLRNVGLHLLPSVLDPLKTLSPDAVTAVDQNAVLRDAVGRADAAVVEMKRVLNQMLELESYNEVLDLLHAIIEDQRKLNDKTRQQRQEQLRHLLED